MKEKGWNSRIDEETKQWPQDVHDAAKEEAGRVSEQIDNEILGEIVDPINLGPIPS